MVSRGLSYFAVLGFLVAGPVIAKPVTRSVTGYFWTPPGDTSPYWTLADHKDCFTALAPTWLSFDATGALSDKTDVRLVRYAHRHGLKVTPLVANAPFKPEVARVIFSDQTAVERNVALLLSRVKAAGADGINVDIEAVAPGDRALYNGFIEALCKAFHAEKLLVTLDLPSRDKDAPDSAWSGFADYAFLAKHADQLQIMCYDEHWSGGSPGPIASIPWIRRVLTYVTGLAPRAKVVMGIPAYGYDWSPGTPTTEVTGLRAQELLLSLKRSPNWDATAQTGWFDFSDSAGNHHTVYFEDVRSLRARLAAAREFGIAGISIWRMGDEPKEFWAPLKKFRNGQ